MARQSSIANHEILLTVVIWTPRFLTLLILHIAIHIVELDVTVPAPKGGLGCAGAVRVLARFAKEEANRADSGTAGDKDTNSRFGDAPIHWDTHGHGGIGIL